MLDGFLGPFLRTRWVLIYVCLTLWLFSLLQRHRVQRRIRAIGGKSAPKIATFLPFGLDFIYQSISVTRQHRNLHFWRSLFSRFGTEDSSHTVETEIGGTRLIITVDHAVIQAVLATQFADFGKGSIFHGQFQEFLGDSIFTTDGQAWHDSRQMVRQLFTRQRIEDLDLFEKHTNTLISHIGRHDHANNLTQLFYCYTLDIATEFLFGQTVGSMNEPQSEFAEAIAEVQRVQSKFARAGTFFPLIPRGGFNNGIKVIDAYIQSYIKRTLSLNPKDIELLDKSSREDYTFLHALAKFTRSPKKIRDEVVNLLFASRDTTAVTLMWLFYELAAKPASVRRLRNEIISAVGIDRLPTPHDLKNMKFLHQVVNETLRLHPAVPINIRYAVRDTIVYTTSDKVKGRPISVCKGDAVAFSALAMQRRDDIYPPVSPSFPPADVFAPERWDSWTPRPWTYIPFNGGPRICVGQQFALMEIWYTVTRLLQKFEYIERVNGGGNVEPMSVKAEIVGSPARDVLIKFREADLSKEMKN